MESNIREVLGQKGLDALNGGALIVAEKLGIRLKKTEDGKYIIEKEIGDSFTKAFVVEGYGLITSLEIIAACCEEFRSEERYILRDVVEYYETEGCEDCGTLPVNVVNNARKYFGFDLLPESNQED